MAGKGSHAMGERSNISPGHIISYLAVAQLSRPSYVQTWALNAVL
jgi:hypothetical protein